MRKIPSQRTITDAEKVDKSLAKMAEDFPLVEKMAAFDAKLKRMKFNTYVAEGFTEAQAFELCRQ